MTRITIMRSLIAAILLEMISARAAVIVAWNFNSVDADANAATGRLEASTGTGAARVVGSLTQAFGSVAGGATSDPDSDDNSQLRLGSFPPQGTENKTSGLEFGASTEGFQNIRLIWDQENSGTASRYWHIQFTLDGHNWSDHEVLENSSVGTWRLARHVSFATVPGANDNPNFGVRIVSEFEDSATGTGPGEYRSVNGNGNYSTAGTFWIDMVSLQGDPSTSEPGGDNTAPSVSALVDIQAEAGVPVEPISFSVADAETSPENLVVTCSVSDPALVSNIELSGSGVNRTLTLMTIGSGSALVTLMASDGSLQASRSFLLTVGSPTPIARWDFNSVTPDEDETTGRWESSQGIPALPLGEVTASFGSVASGATSDTGNDNSMLRVSGFPSRTEANKSAGIEFRANTVGFKNISLRWDHYNSNAGSRHWRVQYTIDGSEFLDYLVFTNPEASAWHRGVSIRLAGVPGVDNNPLFAVRIVAEFRKTATGTGEEAYEPVNEAGSYSGAGTLWMDMFTISGEPISGSAPTLSPLTEQTIRENHATDLLYVTVGDAETSADQLTLSGFSDNPALIASMIFDGSGANRTLVVTPHPGQHGTANCRITVTDLDGFSATATFLLTVVPEIIANSPPLISAIADQSIEENSAPTVVSFTISDAETSAEELSLSAETSNPELISNLILGGSGTNRSIAFHPSESRIGQAQITIRTIDSEGLFAENTFHVFVTRITKPVEAPQLRIAQADGGVILSWSSPAGVFSVESSEGVSEPDWRQVDVETQVDGTEGFIRVESSGAAKFFRLTDR